MSRLPNRYQHATEAFIAEMKSIDFPLNGCTWDDNHWGSNINFSQMGKRYTKTIKTNDLIPFEYRELAKSIIIYNKTFKAKNKSALQNQLKSTKPLWQILTKHNSFIWQLNTKLYEKVLSLIDEHYSGNTRRLYVDYLNETLLMLREKSCISKAFKTRQPFSHENDVSSVRFDKQNKRKMPDERAIIATGHIFSKVMPEPSTPIDYKKSVMDRMICSHFSFSLAAPQRISEITLLSKQPLHEHVDTDGSIYYLLHWRGSKGMQDINKIVHQAMVSSVKRTVDYLQVACEPARILARFYENPHVSLSNILNGYKIKNLHGLELEQPVNLWQLGGLLGFYDAINEDNPLDQYKGFPFHVDELSVIKTIPQKAALFGLSVRNNSALPDFLKEKKITLKGIQAGWMGYIKRKVHNFPYRKHDNDAQVRLSDALFIYTGQQLANTGSAYLFGKSFFSIESIDIKSAFTQRLNNAQSNNENIFYKYGFENKIYNLTSHQFRHFLNTQAQRGSLPETILAKWSGRACVAQNVVYDHRTDDEKHAAIAELYENHADNEYIIVPVDAKEFEEKTGKAATKMSTGFCTQSLYINPCELLLQCIGCKKSCHIKGDQEALSFIQEDLKIQEQRLTEVSRRDFKNKIAYDWLNFHTRQANYHRALIEVLTDPNVEDGAVVRFVGEDYKLLVTNKEITENKVYTPSITVEKNIEIPTLGREKEEYDPMADVDNLIEQSVEKPEHPIHPLVLVKKDSMEDN